MLKYILENIFEKDLILFRKYIIIYMNICIKYIKTYQIYKYAMERLI